MKPTVTRKTWAQIEAAVWWIAAFCFAWLVVENWLRPPDNTPYESDVNVIDDEWFSRHFDR